MKSGGGTDPAKPQQPAYGKVLKSDRWGGYDFKSHRCDGIFLLHFSWKCLKGE